MPGRIILAQFARILFLRNRYVVLLQLRIRPAHNNARESRRAQCAHIRVHHDAKAIVRRNKILASQIQVVFAVNRNAPHSRLFNSFSLYQVPILQSWPKFMFLPLKFAFKPKYRNRWRELDSVLLSAIYAVQLRSSCRHTAFHAQRTNKESSSVNKLLIHVRELRCSVPIAIPVCIHQPLKQCKPLPFSRPQVFKRYMLIPVQPHVAKNAF